MVRSFKSLTKGNHQMRVLKPEPKSWACNVNNICHIHIYTYIKYILCIHNKHVMKTCRYWKALAPPPEK